MPNRFATSNDALAFPKDKVTFKRHSEKTPWAILKCKYQNNPPIPPGFPPRLEVAVGRRPPFR
jgi:hypothetical protein